MKILFLTKELPFPVNSGARMRTWHYVRGLARAGDIHMICYGKYQGQEEGVKVFREMGVDVAFEVTLPPWRACPLILARLMSLFFPFPYSVLLRTSKVLKDRIRGIVKQSACDVLVCDGIHMALNVPEKLECRRILDEHNVESTIIGRFLKLLWNPLAKAYAFLEWIKFRKFEETVWPGFDEIHVCSDVDKQQVEKRTGHHNVKVVPNGVNCLERGGLDTEHGKSVIHDPSSVPRARRIVYSGLMGWRPNDDAAQYFIKEIFPHIKVFLSSSIHSSSSLQFFVVGKDPSETVKKLSEKDPLITVTGFVDDVKPYIYQSDVFVVPLRIGSGTRLKILEAMAMGRAIVSTSIGCEGLDVTHGENIFIADDPDDFADHVVKLLNDEELRGRIAASGRRLVEEKYDWELIETRLAGLIKKS